MFCFVALVHLICWSVFAFSFFSFPLPVSSDYVGFICEIRGSQMISLRSFRNFKTRATQVSLLKLSLFSLKILRSFLMTSPELCEDPTSLSQSLSFLFFIFWDFLFWIPRVWWESLFLCSWVFFLYNYFSLFRDQQSVDFKMVDAHVHQLKGSSSRYRNFYETTKYRIVSDYQIIYINLPLF